MPSFALLNQNTTEIKKEVDKIKRFKDTLFETVRKWAQTLNCTEVNKFDYNPKD